MSPLPIKTALVYYNYRYYNPQDGRWTRRDPLFRTNLYNAASGAYSYDYLGNKQEYSIQQIWNEYLEQNPNRDCSMDANRADILASGCIGYTALMCGKPVDELTGSSKCFFNRQQAEEEMQKWKDEKNVANKNR